MSLLIKWCKNIIKGDGTLDFAIVYAKKIGSVLQHNFLWILFPLHLYEKMPERDWSDQCLVAGKGR